MSDNMIWMGMFAFVIILLVCVIWKVRSVENFQTQKIERKIDPRNFEITTEVSSNSLPIYNYLPHSFLRVLYIGAGSSKTTKVLVDQIAPLSKGYLTPFQVEAYLKPGSLISFQIRCGGKNEENVENAKSWQPYADYRLNADMPKDSRIRALHVGQITTRFLGTTDVFRSTVPFANAQGGLPWLKIHNLTDLPLSLNAGEIMVPAHSVIRYQGYLHMGVPLGSWFRDDDSRYPDYQYLSPQSDLYYGLVSDLVQPISGCWQMEFTDHCEYGQTLWPFEEGIIH